MPTIELTAPETDQPVIPRQRTSGEPTRLERRAARKPSTRTNREPSAARALRAVALLLVLGHQALPYDTTVVAGPIAFGIALAAAQSARPSTDRSRRHGGRKASGWQVSSTGATTIMWLAMFAVLAAGTVPLPLLVGPMVSGLGSVALLAAARRAHVGSFAGPLAGRVVQYLGRLAIPTFGWLALLVGVPALVDRGLPVAVRATLAVVSLLPAMLTLRQFDAWMRNRSPIRPGGSFVIVSGAALSLGGLALAPTGIPQSNDTAAELVAAVSSAPPVHPAAPAQPSPASLPGGAGCWSVAPSYNPATCTFGDRTAKISVALAGGARAGQWLPALQLLAASRHWRITSFLAQDCPVSLSTPAGACQTWAHRAESTMGSGAFDLVLLTDDPARPADHTVADALRKAGKKVVTVSDTNSLPNFG